MESGPYVTTLVPESQQPGLWPPPRASAIQLTVAIEQPGGLPRKDAPQGGQAGECLGSAGSARDAAYHCADRADARIAA